jgi:hypothetical protein
MKNSKMLLLKCEKYRSRQTYSSLMNNLKKIRDQRLDVVQIQCPENQNA